MYISEDKATELINVLDSGNLTCMVNTMIELASDINELHVMRALGRKLKSKGVIDSFVNSLSRAHAAWMLECLRIPEDMLHVKGEIVTHYNSNTYSDSRVQDLMNSGYVDEAPDFYFVTDKGFKWLNNFLGTDIRYKSSAEFGEGPEVTQLNADYQNCSGCARASSSPCTLCRACSRQSRLAVDARNQPDLYMYS